MLSRKVLTGFARPPFKNPGSSPGEGVPISVGGGSSRKYWTLRWGGGMKILDHLIGGGLMKILDPLMGAIKILPCHFP